MQRLSDSAAWVKFACALLGTDLSLEEIAEDADLLLRKYQKRFPALTEPEDDTISEGVSSE